MGIPCLTADSATTTRLQEILTSQPKTSITVDVDALQVQCGDFTALLSIGTGSRQQLTNGTWDACGQLVANAPQTKAIVAKLPYLAWK
jgi:3-isopropylmalate/(R)-2-methylmalate dehydratase small subunit